MHISSPFICGAALASTLQLFHFESYEINERFKGFSTTVQTLFATQSPPSTVTPQGNKIRMTAAKVLPFKIMLLFSCVAYLPPYQWWNKTYPICSFMFNLEVNCVMQKEIHLFCSESVYGHHLMPRFNTAEHVRLHDCIQAHVFFEGECNCFLCFCIN